jgi:multiple sugar transport system substrate-binding protein
MRLRGVRSIGGRGLSAWVWALLAASAAGPLVGCSSEEGPAKPEGPPTFPGVSLKLVVVGDPAVLVGVTASRGEWTASRQAELTIDPEPIRDPSRIGDDVDLIVFPGQSLGGLVDHDLLEPIPNAVVLPPAPETDPSRPNARKESAGEEPEDAFKNDDLAPAYRDQVAKYGIERYALPIGGTVLVLAYRRDAFVSEANQKAAKEQGLALEAPETWEQLDALAKFFQGRDWDGDGQPESGLAAALDGDAEGVANATFLARAASLGQHRDQYSFLFDGDTLAPRVDSPPFVEALGAVVAWKSLGPPGVESFDAAAARKAFREGKAALLIDRAEKAGEWGNAEGKPVGVAALPGSGRVFEPLRKAWETPESPNRPTYLPTGGGWLVGVRAGLETSKKEAAFDLIRYLAGPEVSPRLRAEHDFPMAPVRASQMGQGPPDPTTSADVDVRLWSDAVGRSLMALRVLPGLRIPQADGYLDDLSKGRAAALAGKEPEAVLRDVASAWAERTRAFGPKRQLWHYRRSLNNLATLPQPPARGQ